ncbi:hypothetical protein RC62_3105 [Flavobacterium aquidurense]|uniref:Uncharacterized protein n=1 Tax=Flavobacterium aquidurense TaxID=362413 RepID=A0A0Q0WGH8_9FLAO|nr:hypothetical protein RC62_3105 [Flavobacterium aquidurense]
MWESMSSPFFLKPCFERIRVFCFYKKPQLYRNAVTIENEFALKNPHHLNDGDFLGYNSSDFQLLD